MGDELVRPKMFIGSSVEGLDIAYAIQESLHYSVEVTVWDQGVFSLSRGTLETLVDSLEKYDFAIFVCSPDDVTNIRGAENRTIRDNVIFELGLFIGKLGN